MNHKDNLSLFVGRFNPLTVHHLDVFQQMEGKRLILVTGTEGPRDPLSVEQKMMMLDDVVINRLGDNRTSTARVQNVVDALHVAAAYAKVDNLPNEVILHCGSDRAVAYQRLNTYKDETGVVIKEVVIHERVDDSHSATHLRALAVQGKWNEFQKLCGYVNVVHKSIAYNMIRMHHASLQGKTTSPTVQHHSGIRRSPRH